MISTATPRLQSCSRDTHLPACMIVLSPIVTLHERNCNTKEVLYVSFMEGCTQEGSSGTQIMNSNSFSAYRNIGCADSMSEVSRK